ncbi:MAG TPA: o-succinylbenzoate synthase [Actinomycetota bacterium]|nr:o-succinylbenzoate synthase [Actinomycetota bacterium]
MALVMRPFRIPLRTRFRGVTERAGVLVSGPAGWGEFSPFPEYPPAVAARWLTAAREAAIDGFPVPVRNTIPVNTIVPAVSPEEAYDLVAAAGCTTAKVKVAEGDDEARVAAVRDALGRSGRIRIDANGAWDVDTAVRRIRALDRYDLEYVEQPCRTLDELAAVRRRSDVPIAADESIRTAEDPVAVAVADAADIAVLKVQPLGGVRTCLRVAEACGLPVVVSSAVETSIGIAMGAALAAALPELPYACGLGTIPLLAGDVTDQPLVPVGGAIPVRAIVPSEALLDRWTPNDADALLARAREAEAAA